MSVCRSVDRSVIIPRFISHAPIGALICKQLFYAFIIEFVIMSIVKIRTESSKIAKIDKIRMESLKNNQNSQGIIKKH